MALERAFVPHFFTKCFQNAGIIRVYIIVNGFGMLLYHRANNPIRSRLVFKPPRLPASFTLSNVCNVSCRICPFGKTAPKPLNQSLINNVLIIYLLCYFVPENIHILHTVCSIYSNGWKSI